jgi:hypothetical protein
MTALDAAHAAMMADPDDDAARLAWYRLFADTEVVLWLEAEPEGSDIAPRVLDLETGPVVLVFDAEERLAQLAQGPVPYAALPGRIVAQQLAGQGIGIGVNLGTEDHAFLIDAQAVNWLVQVLAQAPRAAQARPVAVSPPASLPQALLGALDTKLARAGGLAQGAVLAGVTYEGGRKGTMLAILSPLPGAEPALARAVSEALVFSGVEAGELDVAFLDAADPVAQALLRQGLRFDLPSPLAQDTPAPKAPGMDPAKPPRLR